MKSEQYDLSLSENRNLKTAVYRAAALYAQDAAYEWKTDEGPASVSFDELRRDMDALGTALMAEGKAGGSIAICGANSYYWALAYITALAGAGVAVPMSGEETPDGLAYLCRKGEVKLALADDALAAAFPEGVEFVGLQSGLPALLEKGRALIEKGERSFIDKAIDPSALCEILFTSGTTGERRGVMLNSLNLMSIVCCGFPHLIGKRSLSVLPFSHGFEAVCHLLAALEPGVTICIAKSGRRFAQDMLDFRAESIYVVPLQAEALLGPFADLMAAAKDLKVLVCGGAPLSAPVMAKFKSIGLKLMQGYGLSECSPLVTLNTNEVVGSAGKAASYCEIRIAAPDAQGVGEIQVRGDNVMSSYYKDEKETAEAFTEDGWLRTGDMGKLDEDGNLFITGRKKNIIVLPNGENIMPEELEALLYARLPRGSEVRVCEHDGVLTLEGFSPERPGEAFAPTLREAAEAVNALVPPYKRINKIVTQDTPFPKTALGKIKRY